MRTTSTMASNRKRGRDHDAEGAAALPAETPQQREKNQRIPQSIDLDALKKEWTPDRIDRINNGIMKVANKHDPSLCGGDWISNKDGAAVTLSFVFKKDGKYYGLTVAHIFESLCDKVYSFIKKDEVELPVSRNEGKGTDGDEGGDEFDPKSESLGIYEIGKVVSLSKSTDSVVFEFHEDIEVKPPLTVKVASGSTRVIQLPKVESEVMGPPPPPLGKTLVGFGARRRGFHAIVVISSTNETHATATVRRGSICIASPENEEGRITYEGDCGTIFMDLECNGVYFHHEGTKSEPWKSFGAPLWDIMGKHSQLGGTSETPEEKGQRNDNEDDNHVEEGHAKESFDSLVPIPAAKFNVHVVPPPPRTLCRGDFKVPNVTIVPNPHRKKKKM